MKCEDAVNQLNARQDGELSLEEAQALDAHLSECAPCEMLAESLQGIDAELRQAAAPQRQAAQRLAERTIAAMKTAPMPAVEPATAVAKSVSWGQLLVGMAAGFLLAMLLFRPWRSTVERPDVVVAPSQSVARLAIATGPVEVKPVNQLDFLTCPQDAAISQDSVIRTGPVARCEIALGGGNTVRLDCDTEITLRRSKVVEMNRGRLASTTAPDKSGIEIQSRGGKIVAQPAAQLAVACEPQGARVVVVDGTANVTTGEKSLEVVSGKQVRIVEGKVEGEPEWCDTSLETAWVNSVLALRNSDHPELAERVNRLLADMGAAKLSLLYEDELRRLGDDGVPPLLAYLASTRGKPNQRQRTTAAAIVADVAQPRWIPDLIGLLVDSSANVRAEAARGLVRLTGRDQGLKSDQWRTDSWSSCEGVYDKWVHWWEENRDRYPAARREIPATKPQAF